MRYVYFKKVKATNFLSVGKVPVEIVFRPGLNIITGRNYDKPDRSNGVGKSTIADMIYFALYGTTMRELNKEFIVNDQAPDVLCEVELDFSYQENDKSIECKIVRTLNPTKCFLTINGEDKTRSGIPHTNQLITDLIKTTPEVFSNSVIMTINNTVPFLAQKKVEKRKFIEGILGLEVFSKMLLQARSDFNEAKKSLDIESAKSQESNRLLTEVVKQRDNYEKNRLQRLSTFESRRNNNQLQIDQLSTKKDSIQSYDQSKLAELQVEEKQLSSKINDIQKIITEAQLHIKLNSDKLKKLKRIDSKCPHCGKDLAEENNKQYEKDRIECENLVSQYQSVETTQQPILLQYRQDSDKNRVAQDQIKQLDIINLEIKKLQDWQKSLVLDIESLNKESNNFQQSIDQATEHNNQIKVVITQLQQKIDIIESAKLVTSEEGVKSFIVKKILTILNGRLAQYLKKLESNATVIFNEYFEETITNQRGTSKSYHNFSGAERKAIDIAMLFTFQDVRRAQADVWLNISMFDELLDSSLDEKGIELVLDILKERVDIYNEAIYIISHRKESKKFCVGGEVVFLELNNGITTRNINYEQLSI